MKFKYCVMAFCMLFSINSIAGVQLPEKVITEIQAAAQMQPGDFIYVDFWASWCAPCRKSFPWMNSIQEKYREQGLKILAINLDKEHALAEKFLKDMPTQFPIMYDPEGRFAQTFELQGMPSSYLINDKGMIIQSHKGFFVEKIATYEADIQSALNK